MKTFLALGMVCLLVAELQPQERPTLEQLSWLAGCWNGSDAKAENLEQWMKPSGGMMLGMSRTVKGGKVSAFEFLRIHQEVNGDIFYTAIPSGQQQASFKLVNDGRQEFVFENQEHDFPQRIVYRRDSGGSLTAWIEGKSNGKDLRVEFPMKKVSCQ